MRTYRSAYGPASSLSIAPTTQPGFLSVNVAGGSSAVLDREQARDLAKQLLALAPPAPAANIEGDDYSVPDAG